MREPWFWKRRRQETRIDFSGLGKPADNAFVQTFNGPLLDECLNVHWFGTLTEARGLVEAWKVEYNEGRPHVALGNIPLRKYALRAGVRQYEECARAAGI